MNMKFEFSAGGIVYKKNEKILKQVEDAPQGIQDDIKILVAQHSQHHGWVFPKGIIGDIQEKETKEETAIREVKEETGVLGKIIKPLPPITYWYVYEGEKRKKTVYYFLMEYVSGNITEHDWEMENVEWLPIDKVEERLTYPSDKKVWQEAKKLLVTSY